MRLRVAPSASVVLLVGLCAVSSLPCPCAAQPTEAPASAAGNDVYGNGSSSTTTPSSSHPHYSRHNHTHLSDFESDVVVIVCGLTLVGVFGTCLAAYFTGATFTCQGVVARLCRGIGYLRLLGCPRDRMEPLEFLLSPTRLMVGRDDLRELRGCAVMHVALMLGSGAALLCAAYVHKHLKDTSSVNMSLGRMPVRLWALLVEYLWLGSAEGAFAVLVIVSNDSDYAVGTVALTALAGLLIWLAFVATIRTRVFDSEGMGAGSGDQSSGGGDRSGSLASLSPFSSYSLSPGSGAPTRLDGSASHFLLPAAEYESGGGGLGRGAVGGGVGGGAVRGGGDRGDSGWLTAFTTPTLRWRADPGVDPRKVKWVADLFDGYHRRSCLQYVSQFAAMLLLGGLAAWNAHSCTLKAVLVVFVPLMMTPVLFNGAPMVRPVDNLFEISFLAAEFSFAFVRLLGVATESDALVEASDHVAAILIYAVFVKFLVDLAIHVAHYRKGKAEWRGLMIQQAPLLVSDLG